MGTGCGVVWCVGREKERNVCGVGCVCVGQCVCKSVVGMCRWEGGMVAGVCVARVGAGPCMGWGVVWVVGWWGGVGCVVCGVGGGVWGWGCGWNGVGGRAMVCV